MRNVLGLFVVIALTACSSPGSTSDPLVGTWFSQITDVTTDNQTATVTFRADHSYTLVHTQTDSSTSVTPGCVETQTDVGTYTEGNSSGMMTLVLTPTTAMSGGVVRSMCMSANDNGMAASATPLGFNGNYTITGNMLSIQGNSSSSPTVFTRR